MIWTLIGGGAHRTLGTVRSALREQVFQDGGEIRIYDLDASRAQAMAIMIEKSPEHAACPVPVRWDLTQAQALEGAEVVNVTLLAGGTRPLWIQRELAKSYGFLGSDNLSYTGAFLALRGAPILLGIARQMERYCPDAVLLEFANPVAVLTALVRQQTSIRCYGICAGHNNHGWDLHRILTGEDRYNPRFQVEVAGVNHLSFITRGSLDGRELKELLLEREERCPAWAEQIRFTAEKDAATREYMVYGMKRTMELLHEQDALLFSTEPDGYSHLFHQAALARQSVFPRGEGEELLSPEGMAAFERACADDLSRRQKENRRFARYASLPADEIPWEESQGTGLFTVPDRGDVTSKVLAGLAGVREDVVAVSDLNGGAVKNIDPSFVLEYTHRVDKKGLHPVTGLEIPRGVYSMVASLACHQTLLAEAAGAEDPLLLYRALRAYPIRPDSRDAHQLWEKLLRTSTGQISPGFAGLEQLCRRYW